MYGLVFKKDVDHFNKKEGEKPLKEKLEVLFKESIIEILEDTPEKEKQSSRLLFQRQIISGFIKITKNYPEVRMKNFNLMQNLLKKTLCLLLFLLHL